MPCGEIHKPSHLICECQAERLARPDTWEGLVNENNRLTLKLRFIAENESVYIQAVDKFGHRAQVIKAMEELGELQVALAKDFHAPCGSMKSPPRESVIDEIADVIIMAQQLRIIYGPDAVDKRVEYKTKRLLTKLGEHTNA